MSYGDWKPYVPVADRRRKAEKAAAKATKGGTALTPIAPYRGAVARRDKAGFATRARPGNPSRARIK